MVSFAQGKQVQLAAALLSQLFTPHLGNVADTLFHQMLPPDEQFRPSIKHLVPSQHAMLAAWLFLAWIEIRGL